MRFSVLGPLSVVGDDGTATPISSPNQRTVLAVLLAARGRAVSTDELIDAVWPDDPPASALKSLRTYVSRLRATTGDAIAGHGSAYSLDAGPDGTDASEFERLLARADGVDAPAMLTAALGLWRGRAYGDQADIEGVRSEARRLDELHDTARIRLAEALLASGDAAAAIGQAEALVADEPLLEPAWVVLVRALHADGRTADALRAFQRASSALADAGLDPSAELRAAEATVFADEAPTTPPTVPPTSSHRAPSVGHHELPPAPPTPSVGRGGEIDRIGELLATTRLVTLVGPGGVGKTRLATEVARTAGAAHSLGARVVELARIADPAAIPPAIARALGITHTGAARTAIDAIGHLDVLVVLDNCEHVIDGVAELVPRLLAGGDDLRIVATSRERLAIDGEHSWPVAPLATVGPRAPAQQLFVQRAAAASAVDIDPALAEAIVTRLDGLPLAIEMAAARLRSMGAADLAGELDRSVEVLSSGTRRGTSDRHRTLRDVLEWSEALLDDDERAALADFSVFAGSVSARDLAAAIDTADPVATVGSLAERSLIAVDVVDGRARYRLLATVRQFGRDRLAEAGRLDHRLRRHATWFADVAAGIDAEMETDAEREGVRRFDEVFDELRAAHRWARDHDVDLAARLTRHLHHVAFSGLRAEVTGWALRLAEILDERHPDAPVVFGSVAGGLNNAGLLEDAATWAERALALAPTRPAGRLAHEALSDNSLYRGRLDEAIEHAEASLALVGDDEPVSRAVSVTNAALPLIYAGRHEEADARLDTVDDGALPPSGRAWIAYSRGEAALDRRPDEAAAHLDRALTLADAADNRLLAGVARVSLASLRARSGDPTEALDTFATAVATFAEHRNRVHLTTTLRNLVTLFDRIGHHDAAARLLGAVAGDDFGPTYGDEAGRLEVAAMAARDALGGDEFDRQFRAGAARTYDEAVATALEDITTAHP